MTLAIVETMRGMEQPNPIAEVQNTLAACWEKCKKAVAERLNRNIPASVEPNVPAFVVPKISPDIWVHRIVPFLAGECEMHKLVPSHPEHSKIYKLFRIETLMKLSCVNKQMHEAITSAQGWEKAVNHGFGARQRHRHIVNLVETKRKKILVDHKLVAFLRENGYTGKISVDR